MKVEVDEVEEMWNEIALEEKKRGEKEGVRDSGKRFWG